MSADWSPELAVALDGLVPPGDGSRADWADVVARVGGHRRGRPRLQSSPPLRLAIAVALLLLLLAGVATATYLLVRDDGGVTFGDRVRLLVVDPNGPGLRVVAHCPARTRRATCWVGDPAWSHDGKRLAYLRGRTGGLDRDDRISVYIAAASGNHARRLAPCGGCGLGHLVWSPHDRWVLFTRDVWKRGKPEYSLWRVAAAGGKPHRVTACAAPCADDEPSWSPNGRLIVFTHSEPTPGKSGIFTVHPDGTGLTRIGHGFNPHWSPNGHRILFSSGPDSLAIMNADGSHVHVLFAGARGVGPGAPSWSPDGHKIVFFKTPGRPGHYRTEVWTMSADGSGRERLYRSGCCVGFWAPPIWSPDGQMIAFSADSAGGTFVIGADGTRLRRVSPMVADALSWQPRRKGGRP